MAAHRACARATVAAHRTCARAAVAAHHARAGGEGGPAAPAPVPPGRARAAPAPPPPRPAPPAAVSLGRPPAVPSIVEEARQPSTGEEARRQTRRAGSVAPRAAAVACPPEQGRPHPFVVAARATGRRPKPSRPIASPAAEEGRSCHGGGPSARGTLRLPTRPFVRLPAVPTVPRPPVLSPLAARPPATARRRRAAVPPALQGMISYIIFC